MGFFSSVKEALILFPDNLDPKSSWTGSSQPLYTSNRVWQDRWICFVASPLKCCVFPFFLPFLCHNLTRNGSVILKYAFTCVAYMWVHVCRVESSLFCPQAIRTHKNTRKQKGNTINITVKIKLYPKDPKAGNSSAIFNLCSGIKKNNICCSSL